ncbi:uncharacterized protein BX663DRAFT_14086 [Cokeromyces recurvatus]|uniref:uncharacterized protein n=1 Tax=Cokeromyces recurvatus TaxID=90255 RepID=UPI00221F1DDC|nr:uncharacterized protein BX663DRAFT_14086 [Cokeromyces recurvatus]KAI7907893.1 hypothetical protein BX663DRAFT_14086 [Cokeromyces recurvatus]
MTCKDCNNKGHANKEYFKCKFFKEASVDDVGTSTRKRRQTTRLKEDKQRVKRSKQDTGSISNSCTNCGQVGHKSTRSRECPSHELSKSEVFTKNLEFPYKPFNRKIPFDCVINNDYKDILKNKIITTSKDIRNIVFRSMLLTNSYCLSQGSESVPHVIFKQQYWYSICQLVNDKKITNNANIPVNFVAFWDSFRVTHPNAIYIKKKIQNGASQCLAEACTELATCYTNHIVEMFETRLLRYFRYILQNLLERTSSQDIFKISKDFCYQFTYGGNPKWPVDVPNDKKQLIIKMCQVLQNLIHEKPTLANMIKPPPEVY